MPCHLYYITFNRHLICNCIEKPKLVFNYAKPISNGVIYSSFLFFIYVSFSSCPAVQVNLKHFHIGLRLKWYCCTSTISNQDNQWSFCHGHIIVCKKKNNKILTISFVFVDFKQFLNYFQTDSLIEKNLY